jgi:ABC-2 type transport system ATP-binding protein
MAQPAILAENLTYRYGDLTAVDHIGFQVAEGEIFGFLGPNGAGKTTTVKILTGQVRPAEGRAQVLGMDIVRQTKQVQRHIGVAFETTNLYEQLTAVENLQLFVRLYGVKDVDIMDLLQKVGLAGREKERVANYSKGMKQRLMVARAMIHSPRILFLDEPTDGLDPVSSRTIHVLIQEAAARGTAVFLTTHDMVEADKLSNRVAFINQGKIVAVDTPSALKLRYGRRSLRVEVETPDGQVTVHEIPLDGTGGIQQLAALAQQGRILTVHSEEATLEDIFIQITGRGLYG